MSYRNKRPAAYLNSKPGRLCSYCTEHRGSLDSCNRGYFPKTNRNIPCSPEAPWQIINGKIILYKQTKKYQITALTNLLQNKN